MQFICVESVEPMRLMFEHELFPVHVSIRIFDNEAFIFVVIHPSAISHVIIHSEFVHLMSFPAKVSAVDSDITKCWAVEFVAVGDIILLLVPTKQRVSRNSDIISS